MKKKLLTKREIAIELGGKDSPLHVRSVERYIKLAQVRPTVKGSGRGKESQFARDDVDKIKAAYQAAAEQRENKSEALTATKPAALAPVALVAEILASNAEGIKALSGALDSWPIWLTRAEAIARAGMPAAWFDAAVNKKELPGVGKGRGRRYHRNDVRAFAERLSDDAYITKLLQKPKSAKR